MKPMKVGEHLLMVQGINTKQEADAPEADDNIAMVCAKCKKVWVARVKRGRKGAQLWTMRLAATAAPRWKAHGPDLAKSG
jgi:hypothetical protein